MAEIGEGAAADEYEILVDRKSDLGKRIQVSLDFLCKNSTNLQKVLVHLISNNVLSQHESEVIEHKESNYDRFRQLFTVLIPIVGHGDNSQHFFDAFQQSLNQNILEKLKSAVVTPEFAQGSLGASSQSIRFKVREPVPSFIGRKNFLFDLDQEILHSHRTAADFSTSSMNISRIFVVTGLGGVGKTETIRKYIHSYGHCYQHVVWIDAEENNTAENQFRRLAIELQVSSKDIDNKVKDFDILLQEIYDRLCANHSLIVLDNAEALDDSDPQRHGIARFLPKHMPPTHVKPVVLITSRQLEWPDLHTMPLPLWTPQESSEFVFRQLKLEESDANAKDVTTLSEKFGGVPLALQAAVAVIRQESKWNNLMGKDDYTIQHLLSDYNNQGKREVLNNRPPGSPDATPLMLLWKVSLDKIRKQPHGYLATHILNVMAHLSPTNIPKDLLKFVFNSEDEKIFVEAVKLLVDYSFVDQFHAYFSIHRMLQDVTLAHLEASTEKHSQNWFMNLRVWTFLRLRQRASITHSLNRIMTGMMEYWPTVPKSSEASDAVHDNLVHVTMRHVLPKVKNPSETDLYFIEFTEFVFDEIMDNRWVEAENCCKVLITYFTSSGLPSHSASFLHLPHVKKALGLRLQLTWILNSMGRFKEAVDICEANLSSFNTLDDQENVLPEILATKNSLATILMRTGENEEAIKLFSSVLELSSKLHGPTHKSTLAPKNNLALVMKNSGRLSEAKTLHAEILEVRMKDLGPLHLDTVTSKHNMATILEAEGRYDDALEMLREVAEVKERELGPLHASTLLTNYSMGVLLKKQGKDEDALRLYTHVISSYEKASAASHPDCLRVKISTAALLWKQGRLDEAREMLRHVLDIQERLLGPNHISTLSTKHNISLILMMEGLYDDALEMMRVVVVGRERNLGPNHVDTIMSKNSMAYVLEKLEKYEDALRIYVDVIRSYERWSAASHPDCLMVKNNIALILGKQGRFEEATEMLRQVLDIQERLLGPNHEDTINTKDSMAELLTEQGQHAEALKLFEEVLELMMKHLGPLHPKTLETKNSISSLHLKMGNFEKAESIANEVLAAR